MTPAELYAQLADLRPEDDLVFETQSGVIGGGYHVTELRLSRSTAIDCAGGVTSSVGATLQLLDGYGDKFMPVGRFGTILKQSIVGVDGLGEAAMKVEFAHDNQGLGLFHIDAIASEGARAVIRLTPDEALCRPAQVSKAAGRGCCA